MGEAASGGPSGRRPVRRRSGGEALSGQRRGPERSGPPRCRSRPGRRYSARAGPRRKVQGRGPPPRPVAGLFSGCEAVALPLPFGAGVPPALRDTLNPV